MTGGSDGSVRIWDVGARTCVALADHGEDSVCSVAVSPDGSQVASCADDGTVRVSDVGGGPAPSVSTDSEPATAVAYSPNGDVLALGGDHGRVRIWHLGDERETMAHDVGTEAITSMAFSRDGGLLAFGEQYGGVGMWDLAGAGEPVILPGPDTSVMAVAFSATGGAPASRLGQRRRQRPALASGWRPGADHRHARREQPDPGRGLLARGGPPGVGRR